MVEQGDMVGRMRQRVRIEAPDMTADGGGAYTTEWLEVATVWAEVTPVEAAAESWMDGQLVSPVSHVVRMRYVAGVTTTMRLVMNGRIFDIRHCVNQEERGRYLRIFAQERPAGQEEA